MSANRPIPVLITYTNSNILTYPCDLSRATKACSEQFQLTYIQHRPTLPLRFDDQTKEGGGLLRLRDLTVPIGLLNIR